MQRQISVLVLAGAEMNDWTHWHWSFFNHACYECVWRGFQTGLDSEAAARKWLPEGLERSGFDRLRDKEQFSA
jgi:hypothetical protein